MALTSELADPREVEKWLAAERVTSDFITPILVDRFRTLFGHPLAHSKAGDPAPLGLHWCLGPDGLDAATLGPDGRPRGTPGVPTFRQLPSEMWAGVETSFLRPLRVGDAIEHRARLVALDEKNGKSGTMVFATEQHDYGASKSAPCVSERWSVVYKKSTPPAPKGAAAAPRAASAGGEGKFSRIVQTTNVMLFQYSALTYNAHRVHFDQPYSTHVEGYPEILVHGPLTATWLLDTCADAVGADAVAGVKIRAEGPAYCGVRLLLSGRRQGREVTMRAETDGGARVMSAVISLRE